MIHESDCCCEGKNPDLGKTAAMMMVLLFGRVPPCFHDDDDDYAGSF